MAEVSTPDSVGTQVTRILDEGTVTAAELLAEAERQADRAGRDELASLRDSLEARIEAVRSTRTRLAELGEGTTARLRAAASQLADMPAQLNVDVEAPAAESFERAFDLAEPATDGPPPHLVSLMKAAERIADELSETARQRAEEVKHAARREADRIGLEEPQRVTRAYGPAARRAEALRAEVETLNEMLDTDVMGADQPERTKDESGPGAGSRAGRRGRRHRR